MKNSPKFISLLIASGLAGAAFFNLADSSFISALPGDAILAIAFSAAAIGFAISDYSRNIRPAVVPCRVLRPLPGERSGQTAAGQQAGTGLTAYGFNSDCRDRAA